MEFYKRFAGNAQCMEVDSNSRRNVNSVTSQATIRRELAAPAQNTTSVDQKKVLERTLKSTPQIRPEKVAQATALVNDASYPSDAQLHRIADLLAPALTNQEY